MKKLGIYIHIPFCRKKCNYCDFYSVKWDKNKEDNYVKAVIKEVQSYKQKICEKYIVDTIYFGGGTPTVIDPGNIDVIMNSIYDLFDVDSCCEISMEANPNSLTRENLNIYRKAGINRLSIGVQSLNDDILKKIGRLHNSREALKGIHLAQLAGYENINVDLMFNIPGQKINDIESTVKQILNLHIKHISFYSLKLEKNTPLYILEQNKKIKMPGEDLERQMYYAGRDMMEKNNVYQYEISNFAEKGFECRHNLKYWNQEEYIGLGPDAYSFLDRKRYSNPGDIEKYCFSAEKSAFIKNVQEILSDENMVFEFIMLKLRLTKGINVVEFYNKFLFDFNDKYKKQIDHLQKYGLIEQSGDYFRLTKRGMDISNYVFEQFM